MSTSKICIGKNGTCAVRRSHPALHLPGPGKGFTITGNILWNVAANSTVSARRRRKNRQVKCNSVKGTGRLKGSVGNSLPAVSYRGDAGRQERTARSYRKAKVIGNRSGAGDALPRSTETSRTAGVPAGQGQRHILKSIQSHGTCSTRQEEKEQPGLPGSCFPQVPVTWTLSCMGLSLH